jgi:hypothetical protein
MLFIRVPELLPGYTVMLLRWAKFCYPLNSIIVCSRKRSAILLTEVLYVPGEGLVPVLTLSDGHIVMLFIRVPELLPGYTVMLLRWVPDLLPGYTVMLLCRLSDLLPVYTVMLLRRAPDLFWKKICYPEEQHYCMQRTVCYTAG